MKNIIFLFILIGALSIGATVRSGGGITSSGADTATGWTKSGTNVYTTTSTDNVGVGTTKPTALFNINSSATQDLFRIDDNLGSDLTPFIIDQTGNVGIGTAIPLAVLSVSSTLSQTLFRVDDNGDGDKSPFIIDANGNVGIGTNNTERDALLIMNGNVGIGTWVPSTKLDVAGTIVSVGLNVIGGNMGIGTTTPQGALVVTNGNVGIGTWTPASLFEVNGASGTKIQLSLNNSPATVGAGSTGILYTSSGGTSGYISYHTDGSFYTNKSIALQANNTGFIAGASDHLLYVASGNTEIDLYGQSHATIPSIMTFKTAGNERIRIDSNGNVGVGSTVPGALFDIAGKSRITAGGHIVSTGTTPTVANNDCGTTSQGAVVAKSTDNSGTVTVGTLAVTSCAVTFASAWTNSPNCIVIDDTSVLTVRPGTISTTKLTINSTTSMSGDNVTWICQGNE